MNLFTLLILCIGGVALIGFIVGFIRGYHKTKVWALVYIFTVLCSEATVKLLCSSESVSSNASLYTAITISSILIFGIIFSCLFAFTRNCFKKAVEKRIKKSEYQTYFERMENDEDAASALEEKDKKAYKSAVSKKFKKSAGGVGLVSRFVGGFNVAIGSCVVTGMIVLTLLMLLELTQLNFVMEKLGGIYEHPTYLSVSKHTVDALVVALILACVRYGFRNGLMGALSDLVKIGLVFGALYLSFSIVMSASENSPITQLVESRAANLSAVEINIAVTIASISAAMTQQEPADEVIAKLNLAQYEISLIIFLIALILLIILFCFMPSILESIRKTVIGKTVDGVLGATAGLTLALGLLMYIGATLYQINDLSCMTIFNKYFNTYIGSILYAHNPLLGLEVNIFLPLRAWFVGSQG